MFLECLARLRELDHCSGFLQKISKTAQSCFPPGSFWSGLGGGTGVLGLWIFPGAGFFGEGARLIGKLGKNHMFLLFYPRHLKLQGIYILSLSEILTNYFRITWVSHFDEKNVWCGIIQGSVGQSPKQAPKL